MSDVVVQQAPLEAGEFSEYAGRWVAIRDGQVIASADTLEELRENADVRRDDAVYVVPATNSSFF